MVEALVGCVPWKSIEGLLVVHLLGGGSEVEDYCALDLTLCWLPAELGSWYRKLKREGSQKRTSDFDREAIVVG